MYHSPLYPPIINHSDPKFTYLESQHLQIRESEMADPYLPLRYIGEMYLAVLIMRIGNTTVRNLGKSFSVWQRRNPAQAGRDID